MAGQKKIERALCCVFFVLLLFFYGRGHTDGFLFYPTQCALFSTTTKPYYYLNRITLFFATFKSTDSQGVREYFLFKTTSYRWFNVKKFGGGLLYFYPIYNNFLLELKQRMRQKTRFLLLLLRAIFCLKQE